MSRLLQFGLRAAVLLPLGFAAAGCSGDEEFVPPPMGSTDFISHVPGNSSSNEASDGGIAVGGDASGAGGSTTGAPNAPGEDDGGEVERLITEADIIKVEGTKLYALSRYSGLSVIDVADPSNLVLLGEHKTSAMPFEMYVEGDRAYVMYNGWYHWEVDEATGAESWKTTSRIQALDISNPADITVLGQHDTPGDLSDSRKVGDVLYVVTFENGYCWNCESSINTRVSSFNIASPDSFQLIDELRLVDPSAYGGPRSISVTQDRIYVSGQDWGQSAEGVIDVVDIADPNGDLVRGAAVPIAGPIQSRWQIDEFEGTLRVISQPGGWGTASAPAVETFQVTSSSEITKLAKLDVVLPPNEVLQSVRFDGDRAYAITFVQTDPLFTFDLSDPAAPRQVGELEIPGWVYHMEPRGDRIYALGYDNANESGSLHVSLFDVSDLAAPTQLARVNFGGDWASFAEDQNRIHKAFNILADEGLILVPFAGWDYDESDTCGYGSYQSGIQLIDMTEDSLTLRGVAPQVGQARRGFLVGETLMGVSDNAVQTFDIGDRDAPATLGRLELARNISNIRVMGSTMLRFGSDWWTGETTLDFASLADVDQAEPLGDIDLSAYAVDDDKCTGGGNWENQVFVQGGFAYVPRRSYSQVTSETKGYEYRQAITFYIVDLRDREHPTMVGTFAVSTETDDEYLSGIVKTDSAILVGHVRGNYYYSAETGSVSEVDFTYDVISLADPAAPTVVAQLEMPTSVASGGFGYNFSGCAIDIGWGWWGGYYYGYYGGGAQQALASGDIVASQHQKPLSDGSGRVRYYLDQIDVSDPANPVLLPPVNIPGGLVDFNHESGRVVTMDYSFDQHFANDYSQCQHGILDGTTCKTYRRIVHTLDLAGEEAVLLDSALIDQGDAWASGIAATDTRVFASYHSYEGNVPVNMVRTLALGADGDLEDLGSVDVHNVSWGNLVARGDRAFISAQGQLIVVGAGNPDEVEVKSHEMAGYYCEALEVAGDTAYCALGYQGVQAFDLD